MKIVAIKNLNCSAWNKLRVNLGLFILPREIKILIAEMMFKPVIFKSAEEFSEYIQNQSKQKITNTEVH